MGSWDRLREAGFKPNEARRLLDLGPLTQGRQPLPYRYEALAVQAFNTDKLSQERLAKLLRLDPVSARERVEELAHGQFFEDGELYQMSLDLGAELTSSGR